METLTINIKDNDTYLKIKEMESMDMLHIVDTSESYILAGEPLELEDMKEWLELAENANKTTIENMKTKWESKYFH